MRVTYACVLIWIAKVINLKKYIYISITFMRYSIQLKKALRTAING